MKTAEEYLSKAKKLMKERGKTYDKEKEGKPERSMSKTIIAFNAITGHNLDESEGWLIQLLLKQVRQWSSEDFHLDSAEDSVSYSALLSESLEKEDNQLVVTITSEQKPKVSYKESGLKNET